MQIDAKKIEIFLIIYIICDYDVEKKNLSKNTDPKRHIFIPFRVDSKPKFILAG
jgi:hypothetical protein